MKHFYLAVILVVHALYLILLAGCAGGGSGSSAKPPPSLPQPSAESSTEAPAGIDPEKFTDAVNMYIGSLNAANSETGELTVHVSVTYIIGFVNITFSDPASFLGFTDTEKKEYITTLGKALDALASDSIYPGTLPAVGTDTTLYAPDGRELAERTSLGIVKLY